MENKPTPASIWFNARQAATLALAVVVLAVWFWLAGGWDWRPGWIFLGVFVGYTGLLAAWLYFKDPELLKERNQPGENVEPWDKVQVTVYNILMLALLAIAALDSGRFGWSQVPAGLAALGWGLIALTGAIVWHAAAVNQYLSSYARLQPDRGQVVVSRGLYRLVRHPMYLGIILGVPGIPLVLGSLWALIPALLVSALQVYRTAREDQMLQDGLPGYREYCQKVRWRLLPGVW